MTDRSDSCDDAPINQPNERLNTETIPRLPTFDFSLEWEYIFTKSSVWCTDNMEWTEFLEPALYILKATFILRTELFQKHGKMVIYSKPVDMDLPPVTSAAGHPAKAASGIDVSSDVRALGLKRNVLNMKEYSYKKWKWTCKCMKLNS